VPTKVRPGAFPADGSATMVLPVAWSNGSLLRASLCAFLRTLRKPLARRTPRLVVATRRRRGESANPCEPFDHAF
jgi:hypothetical protein